MPVFLYHRQSEGQFRRWIRGDDVTLLRCCDDAETTKTSLRVNTLRRFWFSVRSSKFEAALLVLVSVLLASEAERRRGCRGRRRSTRWTLLTTMAAAVLTDACGAAFIFSSSALNRATAPTELLAEAFQPYDCPDLDFPVGVSDPLNALSSPLAGSARFPAASRVFRRGIGGGLLRLGDRLGWLLLAPVDVGLEPVDVAARRRCDGDRR
jgi:hypothetical protein